MWPPTTEPLGASHERKLEPVDLETIYLGVSDDAFLFVAVQHLLENLRQKNFIKSLSTAADVMFQTR